MSTCGCVHVCLKAVYNFWNKSFCGNVPINRQTNLVISNKEGNVLFNNTTHVMFIMLLVIC